MPASRVHTRRRQPRQARSRGTVEAILVAAARVFRRHGWRATTNRIAAEAGVGVGSLYEYFPNKQALLQALAERHLTLAEEGLAPLLTAAGAATHHGPTPLRDWLTAVQAAVLSSQQFPSQALELVTGSARGPLAERATRLREGVLRALQHRLEHHGHERESARLRARAALGAIGDLTVMAWLREEAGLREETRLRDETRLREDPPFPQLAAELLQMAIRHCEAPPEPGAAASRRTQDSKAMSNGRGDTT